MMTNDYSLNPAQLLATLQMTDSLFPIGAFTHSAGLETYTQQGIVQDAASLQALLVTRLLHGAARSDMIAIHSAMAACQEHDMDELVGLDERLSAMKFAQEARESSRKIGRQMLRNSLALFDHPVLEAYQHAITTGQCTGHHAIVHGLAFAALHIDPQTALLTFAYGQTAGQISAALKLISIGQTSAQQLLHRLIPTMQQAVAIALDSTSEDMQSFTPALEISAMQHQYLFRRLFIS